jgi:hypothetical protein
LICEGEKGDRRFEKRVLLSFQGLYLPRTSLSFRIILGERKEDKFVV